jgi:uncharacterized protein YkwD
MKIFSYILISSALALAGCGGGGDTAAPTSGSPASSTPSDNAPSTAITTTPTLTTQTVTSTAATSTVSTAITAANSCSLPNFQADMLRAVNEARATARKCGSTDKPAVSAVTWNNELFAAAAGHSQDMALNDYFAHNSLDGRTPGQRAVNAGYRFRNMGENIAAGQIGIADVMQDWLESEGHCNAIMSGVFTEVAVSCVATTRPRYPTYWSMELGRRS